MSTPKYGFNNLSAGATAWNGLLDEFVTKLDTFLQTYIKITLGEGVGEGQAVAITSAGKGGLAQAGVGSYQKPSIGMATEDGLTNDEIRVQRVGSMTYSGWNFTGGIGRPVYLDTIAGGVTQVRPTEDIQILGIATDTDTMHLSGDGTLLNYATTTSTTTTTTTTA